MNQLDEKTPLLTRIVDVFLRGDVAVLLIILSLVLGAAALWLTPREEEPQIVVPVADVLVRAPGLSAEEMEQQVTSRLEKLLYQIDGVEYVYSMSRPGESIVTVRFYVGEDREDSLVKLYDKVDSNIDVLPPVVSSWVVKPIEIDDVPIVTVSLFSREAQYGDHELRRLAEQFQNELQAIRNTNRVWVIGGRPRRIRVGLDTAQLAAREVAPLDVAQALAASNVNMPAGSFEQQNEEFLVEAGGFLADIDSLGNLVIAVHEGRPVYLEDVATITDGPAEVESYSWIGFGPAAEENASAVSEGHPLYPAVHIAVAKQRGTNAVRVAEAVTERMDELDDALLPSGVEWRITRDYGETADAKVDELLRGLGIAVLTVIGLIGLVLGWRAALVVALAVPVCYSLTLFVNLLAGYSINRVTMFALVLSLGLLVDDPITDVENIARYFAMKIMSPRASVLRAVQEVRPALILSTLAIIASFVPLFFITGMMGPYMAPMALNVPLTVGISTVVAFLITPWLSLVAMRHAKDDGATPNEANIEQGESFNIERQPLYRLTRRVLGPLLDRTWAAWLALGLVVALLVGAMFIPLLRLVPLKMLPYDNKNEIQLVIDMPEGSTLEETNAVSERLAAYLAGVAEVRDFELFVGTPSPMDFNGMIRHYFLREAPYQADIRVNLVDKENRSQQSHEIVLRMRSDLEDLGREAGANVKLVEVPPGPPVIATVTAEVYGPPEGDYRELVAAAEEVEARLAREPGIVDVDSSAEAEQVKWRFVPDKAKAALSGVSTEMIARTLQLALDGDRSTVLHVPTEVDPLWIELRVPRQQRSSIEDLRELYVRGEDGETVQIGAIGEFVRETVDPTIYHKNLARVAYVYGEVAGRSPADAIIDMQLDRAEGGVVVDIPTAPRPAEERTWLAPGGGDGWELPAGYTVKWNGEGEWKITLDVFRDLGLAFAAALFGIFVILMFQTQSRVLPLLIMLAIPLSLIGIMPGFWLLNMIVNKPVGGFENPVFFTATAMIGMIALSGIVVRNSVVLIDFIHHGLAEGLALREAVIRSVAVRTRPILLTAGTTLLGNGVITLDPIFSGMAWAIIFGILTSTVFTLLVIPVVYWLLYRNRPAAAAAGEI